MKKHPKVCIRERPREHDYHKRYDVLVDGRNVGYIFHDVVVRDPDRFFASDPFKKELDHIYAGEYTYNLIVKITKHFGGYFVEGSGVISYDATGLNKGWVVVKDDPKGRFVHMQGGKYYPEKHVNHASNWNRKKDAETCAKKVGGTVHPFADLINQPCEDHYDEAHGVLAIIALQAAAGITETPDQATAGWGRMTYEQRVQTTLAHKAVCGGEFPTLN